MNRKDSSKDLVIILYTHKKLHSLLVLEPMKTYVRRIRENKNVSAKLR